MSTSNHPHWQALVVRIRAEWVHLSEDDILAGLKRRETFLDRLVHRHHIGVDEAEDQLKKFEEKNPELMFERS